MWACEYCCFFCTSNPVPRLPKGDYFLTEGTADAPVLLTWSGRPNDKVTAQTKGLSLTAAADSRDQPSPVASAPSSPEAAKAAPQGRSIGYPVEHFEIYLGENFERVVADQTAFLSGVLKPEPSGA